MTPIIISPSILSANFAALGDEVVRLDKAGVHWLHLDVMDGSFVPNITFGIPVIQALRPLCSMFFDVHLMIEHPETYIEHFAAAGADIMVIHAETVRHAQKTLEMIHSAGCRAGMALNPGTDFSVLRWLLPYLDMILIMGVNPGFSGQKFIPETIAKIRACRHFLAELGRGEIPIQVDGGASLANTTQLVSAGADILVSGSAFFKNENYAHALAAFEQNAQDGISTRGASMVSLENAATWRHAP